MFNTGCRNYASICKVHLFAVHVWHYLECSWVLIFRNLISNLSFCTGRRGVFDGVVENMHLHWKHRELVKILIKGPLSEVEDTAKMLENESGGILIGIVRTSKGQAVIVYRGRNYQRPSELRPRHLLSKRAALKRSLEMQRKRVLSHTSMVMYSLVHLDPSMQSHGC